MKKYVTYILSAAIALAVGALSGIISGSSMASYEFMAKPPLSPPGWIFPIVWAVLYVLMGIAAAIIWNSKNYGRDTAIVLYAVQLAVNFFWPIFFFVFQAPLLSFFWLAFLIVLVLLTIGSFSDISAKATWLMLPYLLWILFAAYLNLGVYILNK